MKNEEFATARWICRAVVGLLVAIPFLLPSLMAAANSSFFILHSSLPADTLEKARWKVQKTAPVVVADLDSSALDLHFP
jgi:hypothetical protein